MWGMYCQSVRPLRMLCALPGTLQLSFDVQDSGINHLPLPIHLWSTCCFLPQQKPKKETASTLNSRFESFYTLTSSDFWQQAAFRSKCDEKNRRSYPRKSRRETIPWCKPGVWWISHALGGWTVTLPFTWWFWTLHAKLIKSQEQMLRAAAEADSFVFTAHSIVMTTDHALVSTWKTWGSVLLDLGRRSVVSRFIVGGCRHTHPWSFSCWYLICGRAGVLPTEWYLLQQPDFNCKGRVHTDMTMCNFT